MESVFVNLTNHPSKAWDRAQIDAAEKYGQIVDLPFPKVASDKDEEYIKALSDKCVEKVMELSPAEIKSASPVETGTVIMTRRKVFCTACRK